MKRAHADLSGQLPERKRIITVVIQINSRTFNPLFGGGTMRRLRPAAKTAAIVYLLRQRRRIEKHHMVASRAARRTRGVAINLR